MLHCYTPPRPTFSRVMHKHRSQMALCMMDSKKQLENGLKSGQWLLFMRLLGSFWYNVNIGSSSLPQLIKPILSP